MVFFLTLFMRVLLPCLFSSSVFCIVLFLSTQRHLCLLFATFLCLSCFPNSPSHWVTSSKCHHPAQPFPSILFQPCHPDAGLCLGDLITQQLWGLPCRAVWSNLRGINNSPLSIFQKILNIPPSITPQAHIPFVAYSKVETLLLYFFFPGSWSSIKKCCWYPLSTKTVPQNFEFKGFHIWKLPYGKDFICLNTVTSL